LTEARANKQHVTTWTVQQWGMAASFQFTSPGFLFKPSAGWVQDLMKEHKIRYRYVTKYISNKDHATFEEMVMATELFHKQTTKIIPNYSLDYVINTDQKKCKYHANIRQILLHKEEKTLDVLV
jgi:hypothetical protein